MVDQEVADILAEIRQRVISARGMSASQDSDPGVGPGTTQTMSTDVSFNKTSYPGLTVLARAWDRLPPLVSNRTGTSARLELWVKAKLKRALRWFTWEQVNFNAATRQTFLELVESLNAYEQQLAKLSAQIDSQRDELKSELLSELDDRLNALQGRQRAELNARSEALENAFRDFQSHIEQTSALEARDAQSRFTELLNECRLRDERLLDEQRVCFKQLSLELTEGQVLQDRARRELDSRVAKLEGKKKL